MICVEIVYVLHHRTKKKILSHSLPGQKMHSFAVGSLLLNTLNLLLNESTTGNTNNVNLEAVCEKKLTLYIYIYLYIYSFTFHGISRAMHK